MESHGGDNNFYLFSTQVSRPVPRNQLFNFSAPQQEDFVNPALEEEAKEIRRLERQMKLKKKTKSRIKHDPRLQYDQINQEMDSRLNEIDRLLNINQAMLENNRSMINELADHKKEQNMKIFRKWCNKKSKAKFDVKEIKQSKSKTKPLVSKLSILDKKDEDEEPICPI